MTVHQVDFTALATVHGQFKSNAANFETLANTIQTEVASLMNDGWHGDAAVAYNDAYARWNQGYTQSITALHTLTGQVQAAHDTFVDAEKARASGNAPS